MDRLPVEVFAAATLARLSYALPGIALLLALRHATGSYSLAATVRCDRPDSRCRFHPCRPRVESHARRFAIASPTH